MTTARTDRILFWPTALALACFVRFLWYDPSAPELFNGVEFDVILFFWLIAAGVGVIACMVWVFERAWLRLLSTLILPLSVLVVSFNLSLIWQIRSYFMP